MHQTEKSRRVATEYALASTVIEGHVPTGEFLADREAYIRGDITMDEHRARIVIQARALEAQRNASADAMVKT